jgi:hypothetical protein
MRYLLYNTKEQLPPVEYRETHGADSNSVETLQASMWLLSGDVGFDAELMVNYPPDKAFETLEDFLAWRDTQETTE